MNTEKKLQREVYEALHAVETIDAAEIGVAVRCGVVTLTGGVARFTEKLAAERAANRVPGVRAVANELQVCPLGVCDRTDTDLAMAVVEALTGKAGLSEGPVKVSVSDGWVTLEGRVERPDEMERAEGVVRHLIGVRGVFNRIEVRPWPTDREVGGRTVPEFLRPLQRRGAREQCGGVVRP